MGISLRPLHDRLVVKRSEESQTSVGGIFIPDAAQEKPLRGEVVAVGNGKILANGEIRPLAIKTGDVILFGKYTGTEIKLDGSDYLVLREDDVIAVFES